jgi:SAM-dependent methyltransferase
MSTDAVDSPSESFYYDEHASKYAARTWCADMSNQLARFSRRLAHGSRVLDLGSGSGRDTHDLLALGFEVDAMDASPAMARESERRTGVATRVGRVEDLTVSSRYHGIWACAILPHVRDEHQTNAWRGIRAALTPNGICYASYKVGSAPRIDAAGRYFFDLDEASFADLASAVDLFVLELWHTKSAIDDACEWLNVIVGKADCDRERVDVGVV